MNFFVQIRYCVLFVEILSLGNPKKLRFIVLCDCYEIGFYVSACSGGHPAEWIVTDVSQLGEGDRLPTHITLTMGRLRHDSFYTNSNKTLEQGCRCG